MTAETPTRFEREAELVRAAQQGDRDAFKKIYEAYRDRVYSLIFYAVGDSREAEDLLQTVFLGVYRGLDRFRFESALGTWIYRVALNVCHNHRRRRRRSVPLEAILGSAAETDRRPVPEELHALAEKRLILQQALFAMPRPQREVVVLKYVEGLSYEEIAQVLGCAPGTVASRLNRALSALEERLRPFKHVL